MLSLPEEILLLALHDEKGSLVPLTSENTVYYAIAAATIMELKLHNRVELIDKKVRVIDPSHTGLEFLDQALEKIIASKKEHGIKHWVEQLHTGYNAIKEPKKYFLENLVNKGILRRQEKKALWIFTYRVYPTLDPSQEQNVRARLHEIILNNQEPDERNLVLFGLVKACHLEKEIFGKENAKKAKEEITALVKGERFSTALKQIIDEAEAALVAISVVTIAAVD